MSQPTLITCMLTASTVSTAIRVALVVGTLLIAINYGDKILAGSLTPADWIKMFLTYCVPYCVSSYSSAKAMLAHGLNSPPTK